MKDMWGYFNLWLCMLGRYFTTAKIRALSPIPWILGHRGARSCAPENTLISFQKAFELGAHGVEFDVIMSKDGIPVIIHDETLERTTNGHGLVADHTARDLQNLDATKLMPGFLKEGVPTLSQTLSAMPDQAIVNIELKSEGHFSKADFVQAVHQEALQHDSRLRIIYSSFDGEVLAHLRTLAPDAFISLLLCPRDHNWPSALQFWRPIKPDALHIPPSMATKRFLQHAARAKLPVAVWTINDPKLAKILIAQGVMGIFTDHVSEIAGALNKSPHQP